MPNDSKKCTVVGPANAYRLVLRLLGAMQMEPWESMLQRVAFSLLASCKSVKIDCCDCFGAWADALAALNSELNA